MVSVRVTVIVLVFAVICLMTPNTSEAHRACCRRYTKHKLPFNAIKGYLTQTASSACRINAIIFYTRKGKLVCVNPALSWVMESVNRLSTMAQRVHRNTSKA
ncbi:C-C motif chemokine 20a.3 [Sphaeramia orbicularis]|uniref:C-C motif chemokine n=1 Tax=Sphaeramia orbicularis TaxID=375764 RepID=A0A673AKS1_9TELE|nr:C-C motif chemokine 20-like [Sphaeramia orbicularis]